MFYVVKTPWWLRKIYSSYVWKIDTNEKELYLTFDDGPHPGITKFVLQQLKEYNAKASFFCIGKNVAAHPAVYQQIVDEGHSVGNHTQDHLNGWKTNTEEYLKNIAEAANSISSPLFRPPYGRIRSSQARRLHEAIKDPKLIMWDVLSGDFDQSLSKEKCLSNVTGKSRPGSIIVFHDSEKAFPRVEYVLPRTLSFFTERGFKFRSL
ncbi:MAG TPA: polysaccharide deacetylase family protein [Chitinophagaceae bacterium]